MVNAFMQNTTKREHLPIAYTTMRRRKTRRLIRVCAICYDKHIIGNGGKLFVMLSTFLVMVENIKSYINQDLFHFVNGC